MSIDRRTLFAASAGFGAAGLSLASHSAAGNEAGPLQASSSRLADMGGVVAQLEQSSEAPQTRPLQAAIDAAAESGTPVLLPPGRFVTGTLRLRSRTRLIGAHGASELVAAETGPLLTASDAAGLRICGVALDGAAMSSRLISLDGCGGAIENCSLTSARHVGLFANDSIGLLVSQNIVSDCGDNGIQIWRSSVADDGSQVVQNRVSRISARSGGTGQNGNGVNVFRAGGVTVSGNHIDDCAYSAVRGNAASNLQVLANQCRQIGEVAIYAEFGFQGAVIAHNVVDTAATGISVTNFNEGGRLAVVTGNLLRNLKRRAHEPVDQRGNGISVEADTTVTGNVIENAEAAGLLIGWGVHMRNVLASANVIRSAEIGIGITSVSGAGSVVVTDNIIAAVERGGILGLEHGRIAGGELADGETRTQRVRIHGNMLS